MAKKHFGRFMALAAVSGAVAASISYFLRYRSFHKELDEEFHDFEDDFGDDLKEFGETPSEKPMERSYVPISTERQAKTAGKKDGADKAAADSESPVLPRRTGSKTLDGAVGRGEKPGDFETDSKAKASGDAASGDAASGDAASGDAASGGAAKKAKEASPGSETKRADGSTTITEDAAE